MEPFLIRKKVKHKVPWWIQKCEDRKTQLRDTIQKSIQNKNEMGLEISASSAQHKRTLALKDLNLVQAYLEMFNMMNNCFTRMQLDTFVLSEQAQIGLERLLLPTRRHML